MVSLTKDSSLIPDFIKKSDFFFCTILDVDGRISDLNPAIENHGITRNSLLSDYLRNDSSEALLETLNALMANPKRKESIILFWKDEKIQPIRWEFSMLIDDQNDPIGLVGLGVSLNLHHSDLSLFNLLDLLNSVKITLSEDFKIVDVEGSIDDAFGVCQTDLEGNCLFDYFDFSDEIINSIQAEKWDSPWKVFKLSNNLSLIFLKQNDTVVLFMQANSLSRIDSSRNESWDRDLLELMPGPVWLVDEGLNLIQLNSVAEDLISISSGRKPKIGELIDWSQKPVFYEKFHKKLSQGLDSQIDWSIEVDDKHLFYQLRIKAFHRPGVFLVHGFELSKMRKQIQLLQEENKLLRELVLKPSHILRSPLSSMLGLLDLIDEGKLDSENKKYFKYMKPLAKELDHEIRVSAERASRFD